MAEETPAVQKASADDTFGGGNLLVPIAELLFVVLPLLVISIVQVSQGESFQEILFSPEWSFGSAVLFGHGLIKLIAGTLKSRAEWEPVTFVSAIVIVLGLVPSLTVLALILSVNEPSKILMILQIVLFILGCATFLFLGFVGHIGLFKKN